jgi:mevalonate kinase
MSACSASAPGKVILFGEHAVVYGRPAIAVPVAQVQATVTITPSTAGFRIEAADLGRACWLEEAERNDPLAQAVRVTLGRLRAAAPDVTLTVRSTIPIASGMGSGAAVSVAIIRALAEHLGTQLPDEVVSSLAYQIEEIHHGTPSGIDNTVVTYCRPVYFVRGQPIQTFRIHTPFRLLIADTGIASPTKTTVAEVRRNWERRPANYEALFDRIGDLADAARIAIQTGEVGQLGPLMNRNQVLLRELGVSCEQLDTLSRAALAAGGEGAKLSGAGRGGNLIVLVRPETESAVSQALRHAGAVGVIPTWVGDRGDTEGWGFSK